MNELEVPRNYIFKVFLPAGQWEGTKSFQAEDQIWISDHAGYSMGEGLDFKDQLRDSFNKGYCLWGMESNE